MKKAKKTAFYMGHDFLQGGEYCFSALKTKTEVIEIMKQLHNWKQAHDVKFEKGVETEKEFISAIEKYEDLREKLLAQLMVLSSGVSHIPKQNYEQIHDEVKFIS